MKRIKKVISLTVAAAIMAAAMDVSNVMAAESTIVSSDL